MIGVRPPLMVDNLTGLPFDMIYFVCEPAILYIILNLPLTSSLFLQGIYFLSGIST